MALNCFETPSGTVAVGGATATDTRGESVTSTAALLLVTP